MVWRKSTVLMRLIADDEPTSCSYKAEIKRVKRWMLPSYQNIRKEKKRVVWGFKAVCGIVVFGESELSWTRLEKEEVKNGLLFFWNDGENTNKSVWLVLSKKRVTTHNEGWYIQKYIFYLEWEKWKEKTRKEVLIIMKRRKSLSLKKERTEKSSVCLIRNRVNK